MLSCCVCLVSGTSFSVHLLLPSLFFTQITPCPLLYFIPLQLFTCNKLFLQPWAPWGGSYLCITRLAVICFQKAVITTARFTAPSRALCRGIGRTVNMLLWTFSLQQWTSIGKIIPYHTPLKRGREQDTLSRKHSRMKYLIHDWGASHTHIIEGPLLMLIEHKGTALMHLTFRGPCFHHKVKGKWYLKIPLDA